MHMTNLENSRFCESLWFLFYFRITIFIFDQININLESTFKSILRISTWYFTNHEFLVNFTKNGFHRGSMIEHTLTSASKIPFKKSSDFTRDRNSMVPWCAPGTFTLYLGLLVYILYFNISHLSSLFVESLFQKWKRSVFPILKINIF